MKQGSGRELFGSLLARPGFRADLLYFIRLAGNYAASIFADVRNRAPLKHRKAFDDWLAARSMRDDGLRAALTRHDAWFDALKADFTSILDEMPIYMRDRLNRALQEDHVIPWDLRNFICALDDLRDYRGWLEHSDERMRNGERRPRLSDDRLLEVLGLMLLPFLCAHLSGRIRHHGLRAGMPRHEVHAMTDAAKAILDLAKARRSEASRFMNGLKRRVDHDTVAARLTRKYGNPPGAAAVHRIAREDAKKRRDLEDRKKALLELHRRYFDEHTWPRYNLENFLIRFGFIGRARIAQLERRLGLADQAKPDFNNAIEPAFMVSMDVALILHAWLTGLEAQGVDVRSKKQVGEIIVALRNTLAHGGWFWDVHDFRDPTKRWSFSEVLAALLDLPGRKDLSNSAELCNDLVTRLEGALRPCRWIHVYRVPQPGDDPNIMPARHVLKRWTTERRARFADNACWRKEKRPALRRLAAGWMRDIANARAAASGKN